MTQVVVAMGLILLILPGWFESRHHGLDARRRARAYRTALLVGLIAVVGGSLLWAAPIVWHLADGLGLPGLCDGVVHALPLGGFEFAIVALVGGGLLLVRLVGSLAQSVARGRDARVDTFVGSHREVSEFDVVVIASDRLLAVGVPGDQPQIVITDGLVAALESDELDAVLRHEIAHHRLGHRNYLVLASTVNHAFGWIPAVRSSAAALAGALEEWADLASTRLAPERVARLRSALNRLAELHVTTAARRALEQRLGNLDRSPASARTGSGADQRVGLTVGLAGAGGIATLLFAVGYQTFSVFGSCTT